MIGLTASSISRENQLGCNFCIVRDEGSSVTLAFNNQLDPSPVDTDAGFLYSFDCTDDSTFEVIDGTADNFACSYDDNGVYTARGRIKDKDGDFTDYTVDITVLNVAPVATFINNILYRTLLRKQMKIGLTAIT